MALPLFTREVEGGLGRGRLCTHSCSCSAARLQAGGLRLKQVQEPQVFRALAKRLPDHSWPRTGRQPRLGSPVSWLQGRQGR